MEPKIKGVLERLRMALLRLCGEISFREIKENPRLVAAFEGVDNLFRRDRIEFLDDEEWQ